MAKLQVLTYAKREALDVLGAYDSAPEDAEGVPICGGCGTEIEATSKAIQDERTAPFETLFHWDGNVLLCGGCVLRDRDHDRIKADRDRAISERQWKSVIGDAVRLTRLTAAQVIERFEAKKIKHQHDLHCKIGVCPDDMR